MRLRFTLLVVAIVAVVALAACGGSDEDQVKDTVKTYFEALADGDGEKACSQLSGDGTRELIEVANQQLPGLGSIDCAEIVDQLSGSLGEDERDVLRNAEINDVQIEGDEATAEVGGAPVSPILIKSDGDWLIDSGFLQGSTATNSGVAPEETTSETPEEEAAVEEISAGEKAAEKIERELKKAGFKVRKAARRGNPQPEAELDVQLGGGGTVNISIFKSSEDAKKDAQFEERSAREFGVEDRTEVEVSAEKVYFGIVESPEDAAQFQEVVGIAEGE